MLKYNPFSPKQKIIMTWWIKDGLKDYDGIICDGAIRSGKTLCTSISFVAWATANADGKAFAICGKTITSLKRNLVVPLLRELNDLGFKCKEKKTGSYIDISFGNKSNRFYLFGGKDEGSAALIQGVTLAGVLLDEVALMPRSFVEQALARCSDSISKLWFNCNPENPHHWFYNEWIKKTKEKNILYLHFSLDDNPSLSLEIKKRYKRLYSGVFYERFIEGKWTAQTGTVYPMFDYKRHVKHPPSESDAYYISCDYGTVNPSSFGLWAKSGGRWYRISEYYYDSRKVGQLRTDEEHYTELERLAGTRNIQAVIVDPSAASFIECIRRHGAFRVIPAKNQVISGIRKVSDALQQEKIFFSPECSDTIREFSLYSWEESETADKPKKEHDHAMDDIRYFVSTVLNSGEQDDFFVLSAERN